MTNKAQITIVLLTFVIWIIVYSTIHLTTFPNSYSTSDGIKSIIITIPIMITPMFYLLSIAMEMK